MMNKETQCGKYYFTLRDQVWDNGRCGHTRLEIHEMAKARILPMLMDEDANFIDINEALTNPLSTRYLSDQGWEQFIEQFKSYFIYV